MKKKLLSLIIGVALVFTTAVTAFAADPPINKLVGYNDYTLVNHGRIFEFVYEDSNGNNIIKNQVLNVYTSSDKAQSGDKITTWRKTRSATQIFHRFEVNVNYDNEMENRSSGIIIPDTNYNVSINFSRSGANPEVNLYTVLNNYLYDTVTFFDVYRGYYRFYMKGRAGYGKNYIYVTAENTAAGDGYGTSNKCRWNTGGSLFNNNDNPNDFT